MPVVISQNSSGLQRLNNRVTTLSLCAVITNDRRPEHTRYKVSLGFGVLKNTPRLYTSHTNLDRGLPVADQITSFFVGVSTLQKNLA